VGVSLLVTDQILKESLGEEVKLDGRNETPTSRPPASRTKARTFSARRWRGGASSR
jgi:hypothetical protein